MIAAIGGSASVGKTTLATALHGRLGLTEVVHVDELAPELGPSFIDQQPDVWLRPHAWRHDKLLRWTARLHPLVEREVARLLEVGQGIVEGQGVEPRMAIRWDPDFVRPVYVIETDPEVLYGTFADRSSAGRFLALTETERNNVVEMNRRYGCWLRDEAEAAGQPWVPSQPGSTLAERALAALGLAART